MRRSSGFTLIEVMVSISLLGILLLLVASSFFTANRTVKSTSLFAERLDEVRAGQRFLRETLQAITPVAFAEDDEQKRLFEGDAQSLRFVSPVPVYLGGKLRIHRVESFMTEAGELQLRVAFFQEDGIRPWGQSQVLMSRLKQIRFRYRGLDEERKRTGWLNEWPWPRRLPESIQIEADVDGPVRWPLITVLLRKGQVVGAGR